MRELEVNSLIDLFNSGKTDYEAGEQICVNLDSVFNCLGSYAKISKYIYDNLTKLGKERFYIIWCIAGMELYYSYVQQGCDTWDDRKKASMIFSYCNIFEIEELFNFYVDLSVDISSFRKKEDIKIDYFARWFEKKVWEKTNEKVSKTKYAWLVGFSSKWICLHSTIKQSYFGGTCRGVIELENPKGIFDNLEDMCFPFI